MATTGRPRIAGPRAHPTANPSGRYNYNPRSTVPLPKPPAGILPSVPFPPELWLEIIGHVNDAATLFSLMRVNRAFNDMVGGDLYHSVTLHRDPTIVHFCTAVSASPRRATLVTSLHLPDISGQVLHGHDSRLCLSVLTSLHNLKCLTLSLSDGLERSGVTNANLTVFRALASLRFPLLRSFSTNLSVYVFPAGLAFFHAHPLLEDVDFRYSPVSHIQSDSDGLANLQLGSLRTMACSAWFLHDRFVVPPTLTHYHARDLDLRPQELARIARLLGHQLVSLRVSERYAYHSEQWRRGDGPHAILLDELASLFPRLRFLQLDMHLVAVPYISKHAVNCTDRPAEPRFKPVADGQPLREPEARGLTLAWVCDRRPWSSHVDMNEAPAVWDAFLKSRALDVLANWHDYVERVVYRHTGAAWKSVALSEDSSSWDAGAGGGARPVYVYREETGMQEDEWKLI